MSPETAGGVIGPLATASGAAAGGGATLGGAGAGAGAGLGMGRGGGGLTTGVEQATSSRVMRSGKAGQRGDRRFTTRSLASVLWRANGKRPARTLTCQGPFRIS